MKDFSKYLRENGWKYKDTPRIMVPLQRLSTMRAFPTLSREEISQPTIKKAMSLATDRPVHKVSFLSLERLLPQPEWMSDGIYGHMRRKLTKDHEYSVDSRSMDFISKILLESIDYYSEYYKNQEKNHKDLMKELRKKCGPGITQSFIKLSYNTYLNYDYIDSVIEDLVTGYERCIAKSFGTSDWLVTDCIGDWIKKFIFDYLVFLRLGNTKKANYSKRMIELTRRGYFILGFKNMEPETLILVCR